MSLLDAEIEAKSLPDLIQNHTTRSVKNCVTLRYIQFSALDDAWFVSSLFHPSPSASSTRGQLPPAAAAETLQVIVCRPIGPQTRLCTMRGGSPRCSRDLTVFSPTRQASSQRWKSAKALLQQSRQLCFICARCRQNSRLLEVFIFSIVFYRSIVLDRSSVFFRFWHYRFLLFKIFLLSLNQTTITFLAYNLGNLTQ